MVPVFRMVATKVREMMIEALEHQCGVILPGEDHDLFIGPPSGPVSGAWLGPWVWRGPVTLWYHSWLQRDNTLPGNQPERQCGEIM